MSRQQFKAGWKDIKKAATGTTDTEQKVKDATSNEKWGASSTQMRAIAELSFRRDHYAAVMSVIWRRLNDSGKNWRHVYKAMSLLDFLVANGSDQVIDDCRQRHRMSQIRTLMRFEYIDADGKDVGRNVRERAKKLSELLRDDERIADLRKAASKNRDKYVGYSSSDAQRGIHPQSSSHSHHSHHSYDDGPSSSNRNQYWSDPFQDRMEKQKKEKEEQIRKANSPDPSEGSDEESEEESEEEDEEVVENLVDLGLGGAPQAEATLATLAPASAPDVISFDPVVSNAPAAHNAAPMPAPLAAPIASGMISPVGPTSPVPSGFDDNFNAATFNPRFDASIAVPAPAPVSITQTTPQTIGARPIAPLMGGQPSPQANDFGGFEADFGSQRFAPVPPSASSRRPNDGENLTDLLDSSIVDFSFKDNGKAARDDKSKTPSAQRHYRPLAAAPGAGGDASAMLKVPGAVRGGSSGAAAMRQGGRPSLQQLSSPGTSPATARSPAAQQQAAQQQQAQFVASQALGSSIMSPISPTSPSQQQILAPQQAQALTQQQQSGKGMGGSWQPAALQQQQAAAMYAQQMQMQMQGGAYAPLPQQQPQQQPPSGAGGMFL